jgi:1L-myo-inositol 1-phosphate cytidylyltransferase / CDP-L-myo-inositol myo-inositolphosphotransferase
MAARSFVLVLLPAPAEVDLRRRVAGLNMPLRLALTAQASQASGATAVHLAPDLDIAALLVDPRLRIPVRSAPAAVPEDQVEIEVHANVVVHRGLFSALRDATSDGRARSIGAGDAIVVARAARADRSSEGPPVPFVFAPAFSFSPISVSTSRDARRATTALLHSLRKTQDGWTSTYLNRYISLAVTRLLVLTPIRPNPLSVAILGLGLASGIVAARGTHDALVIGAALLQSQSVLDGCDGELSRLTFRGSRLGEWLDTIGDDLSNYGFFAGASYGLWRSTGWVAYLIVGATIVACGLIASGLEYRYLAKIGSGDLLKYPLGLGDEGGTPATVLGRIGAAVRPLFKRDTFVFLTFLAAAAGVLGPMLGIFAVGAIGIVIAVIKAEVRMARTGK